MVECVESINRDFQPGHTFVATSRVAADHSSRATSSGGSRVAAVGFGSVEADPLCKMKVDAGITRPCSRIASDSRRAGGRYHIAVVKVSGGDIERDSGTQINNCSSPEAPAEMVGAD